jgi:hypothetical protein
MGIAEALGTIFLDTALYGKPTQDWLVVFKQVFSNPAATGTVLGFDYSNPLDHLRLHRKIAPTSEAI